MPENADIDLEEVLELRSKFHGKSRGRPTFAVVIVHRLLNALELRLRAETVTPLPPKARRITGPKATMGELVTFDLDDGGRVHIPRQKLADLWNKAQAGKL